MDETNPYESPKHAGDESGAGGSTNEDSRRPEAYRSAILWAVLQQLVVLGFTSLLLDGGRTFRVFLAPAIGFWPIALLIMLRRPNSPTRNDVGFVKFGYWLMAAPVVIFLTLGLF